LEVETARCRYTVPSTVVVIEVLTEEETLGLGGCYLKSLGSHKLELKLTPHILFNAFFHYNSVDVWRGEPITDQLLGDISHI
jgi:hypothetical protein